MNPYQRHTPPPDVFELSHTPRVSASYEPKKGDYVEWEDVVLEGEAAEGVILRHFGREFDDCTPPMLDRDRAAAQSDIGAFLYQRGTTPTGFVGADVPQPPIRKCGATGRKSQDRAGLVAFRWLGWVWLVSPLLWVAAFVVIA